MASSSCIDPTRPSRQRPGGPSIRWSRLVSTRSGCGNRCRSDRGRSRLVQSGRLSSTSAGSRALLGPQEEGRARTQGSPRRRSRAHRARLAAAASTSQFSLAEDRSTDAVTQGDQGEPADLGGQPARAGCHCRGCRSRWRRRWSAGRCRRPDGRQHGGPAATELGLGGPLDQAYGGGGVRQPGDLGVVQHQPDQPGAVAAGDLLRQVGRVGGVCTGERRTPRCSGPSRSEASMSMATRPGARGRPGRSGPGGRGSRSSR